MLHKNAKESVDHPVIHRPCSRKDGWIKAFQHQMDVGDNHIPMVHTERHEGAKDIRKLLLLLMRIFKCGLTFFQEN